MNRERSDRGRPVAIIGGGWAGLAAAWTLATRGVPVKVGSHSRSNGRSEVGLAVLAPSDSPGGLIQAQASTLGAGTAFGRSPRPAPATLHQLSA